MIVLHYERVAGFPQRPANLEILENDNVPEFYQNCALFANSKKFSITSSDFSGAIVLC